MKDIVKKKDGSKIRLIIFLAAAGLILAATIFFGLKGTKDWSSVSYGTTTDNSIAIGNNDVFNVLFSIDEDGFQGIQVKLASEIKAFEEESLLFSLTDSKTGEELADYELPLKNAVSQTAVFIPLRIEKSAGREVALSIRGKDIYQVPRLCTSLNYDLESELYSGDKLKPDTFLVFSSVFLEESRLNYKAFIEGGIYLFLLLLLWFWPAALEKEKARGGSRSAGKWLDQVRAILHRGKKGILFILLTGLFFSLAVFVYKNNLEERLEKKTDVQVTEENEEYEHKFTLKKDTGQLLWTFVPGNHRLSQISFTASVADAEPDAGLQIRVFDPDDNICYHESFARASSLPAKKGVWNIFLTKEFTYSAGREVKVYIRPVGFDRTRVIFYTGEPVLQSHVYQDGRELNLSLQSSASFENNDYLLKLYKIYVLLLYGFLVMCFILLAVMHCRIERLFVPVALYLGVLYMLLIPVYSVPDEYTHMDSAYRLSDEILGLNASEENLLGYDYKRADDVETEEYLTYQTTLADYRRLYTELTQPVKDTSFTLTVSKGSFINAGKLYHLPAAAGILLAQMLGMGTLQLFLMGRLFSLAAYVLLCCYALKKLPGFKWLFFFYVTTPIALQEAASYSYDAMLNAIAMVFSALCLSYAVEEKHTWADHIILFLSMVQLATVKGGVYLPMCFLVCLIPVERGWRLRSGIRYFFAVALVVLTAFLQNNIVRLISSYFHPKGSRVNPFSGGDLYTFSYLIHHPFKAVSLFVNTFFIHGSRLVYEFFGGKMGSLTNIQLPWMYVLAFLLLFLFIACAEPGRGMIRKRFSLIGTALVSIMTAGLLGVSMLLADTSVKYDYIVGLQGRYYFPCVFALLAVAFGMLKQRRPDGGNRLYAGTMTYFSVQLVFILNTIMVIITNNM